MNRKLAKIILNILSKRKYLSKSNNKITVFKHKNDGYYYKLADRTDRTRIPTDFCQQYFFPRIAIIIILYLKPIDCGGLLSSKYMLKNSGEKMYFKL